MKIHIIFPAALAALVFTGCSQLGFKEPQPSWVSKNEAVFPVELRGYYLASDWGSDTINHCDTVVVSATSVKFFYGKGNGNEVVPPVPDFALSDSVLLKKDKSGYFLNTALKELNAWNVVWIKNGGKDIMLYAMQPDSAMTRLKAITQVQIITKDSASAPDYIINPTVAEFKKMQAQNLFVKAMRLQKIKAAGNK